MSTGSNAPAMQPKWMRLAAPILLSLSASQRQAASTGSSLVRRLSPTWCSMAWRTALILAGEKSVSARIASTTAEASLAWVSLDLALSRNLRQSWSQAAHSTTSGSAPARGASQRASFTVARVCSNR